MEASIFRIPLPDDYEGSVAATLVRFAGRGALRRGPYCICTDMSTIFSRRTWRDGSSRADGASMRSICASTAARWRPARLRIIVAICMSIIPRSIVRSSPDASGPDRTDRSDGPFDRRIARFAVRFRRPASCRHRATDSQQSFFRVQRVMVQKARSRSCCRRSRTAVALCS